MMQPRAVVLDASETDDIVDAWDSLAERVGRPFCSPHWVLPWATHVATHDELRCVAVFDRDELVGVAPLVARREFGVRTFRMSSALGAGTPREPLAAPGRERDVCVAIATSLADGRGPDLVAIDGMPTWRPWTTGLAAAWPRATVHRELTRPLTWIDIGDRSFEDWLATKGTKTRKSARRLRRRLEDEGATFALATTPASIAPQIETFVRLHRAQWDEKQGGSAVVRDGTGEMLRNAADRLAGSSRMWVASIEHPTGTLASEIFVAAGSVCADWLGGFDPGWARFSPGLVVMMHGIAHAAAVGARTVELGAGRQPFKQRLGDGQADVAWDLVVPSGVGSPLATALALSRVGRRRGAAFVREKGAGRTDG